MPYIINLNPSDPANTDNAGGAAQELRDLKTTLKDQFPSLGEAAVTATAAELNALDGNLDALATEVGFDFGSPGTDSRIDTLESTRPQKTVPETISGAWDFTGGAVDFTNTPRIASVDVATVDDIPTKRTTNQVPVANKSGNYTVVDDDFANCRKIRYNGTGDAQITIPAGQVGDLLFVTNASTDVLTVAGSGVTFRNRYNDVVSSFTITGRYKVVGFHMVTATSFEISGDYD